MSQNGARGSEETRQTLDSQRTHAVFRNGTAVCRRRASNPRGAWRVQTGAVADQTACGGLVTDREGAGSRLARARTSRDISALNSR